MIRLGELGTNALPAERIPDDRPPAAIGGAGLGSRSAASSAGAWLRPDVQVVPGSAS
jgi:hypothetical protein